MTMLDLDSAAGCFAELGHPTRLAIYRRLVQAGTAGMPVGALGEEFGVVPSTLSHHIKQLVAVGLIEQEREGRTLICRPVYPRMEAVLGFLQEECCLRPVVATAEDGAECGPPCGTTGCG